MQQSPSSRSSAVEITRRLLFLLLLWLPMLLILATRDPRFPLPRGLADAFHFPGEFRHYFSHHFPLRDRLAGIHNRLLFRLDGPTEVGPVTVGTDGWLFLRLSRERIDESVGHERLVALRAEHERRANWCRQRGIAYRVLVVPSKDGVYTEHLPARYATLMPERGPLTVAARFLMTKASDVHTVDLLGRFLREKSRAPLYFKTDSHWTEFGGYLATLEVMKSLPSGTNDMPPEKFEIRIDSGEGGNEAQILGLRQNTVEAVPRVILREGPTPRLKNGQAIRVNTINLQGFESSLLETVCHDASGDGALIFHNSFGVALVPFLSRHFKSCTFVWNPFDTALIEHRRPGVVIDVLTTL